MNLHILPNEMFFTIFNFLDINSIRKIRLVDTIISYVATDHLRQKYYYVHGKITNNEIKKEIKCLVAESIKVIQEYSNLRELYLICNKVLQPGVLPATLKNLQLGNNFNKPIETGVYLQH